MAGRPLKESLEFSPWDVSILDNDEKIDMLIDAQGIAAFTVYFYLCQKAYGSKGYYLDWSYSRCATVARRLGKGASADYVKNVVDMCFQCCLFDKRLFELYGILTSKGIQKRYLPVAKARTAPQINDDYWLLDEEESAGLDLRTQKLNYQGSKSNYQGSKSNYPIQENSRVENSRVEKRERARAAATPSPALEEVKAFFSAEGLSSNPDIFFNHYKALGWKNISDWKAKAREWSLKEKKPETADYSAYDLALYEQMLNRKD